MRHVALVATVALVLVACASPVSPAGASPSASVGQSQSGAPDPSPIRASASPSSTANGPRITWSEVDFRGHALDVIGDRTRFVAVGTGTSGASAWTSQDGSSWVEHDVPERSFGEVGDGLELTGSMGTLVRLGDTLYSFGGMSFMDSVQGVGWRWTDGQAWEVIQSRSDFYVGKVHAVAAGDDELLAATTNFATSLYGSFSTWRWTPAASWTQTPLSSSEDEEISVESIAWFDGMYLAAGSSAIAVEGVERWDWPRMLSMWTSADGVDWTAVELPQAMSGVCAVASINDRFVAFGTTGERVAAWTSGDGSTWAQSAVTGPEGDNLPAHLMGSGNCKVLDVGGGLAAFASLADDTLVWTSSDGYEWTFQGRLGISTHAAAALGRHLIVVGSRGAFGVPEMLLGVVAP